MNDEDQPGSLADQAAAWIPPWQRAATAPPADVSAVVTPFGAAVEADERHVADDPIPDDEDVQRPETQSPATPETASLADTDVDELESDVDEDDFQRPETDRFAGADEAESDDDDDDEDDDFQRPETDRFAGTGEAESDDDDEDDDFQRPETDRFAGTDEAESDDDDDDDEDDDFQRPETDSFVGVEFAAATPLVDVARAAARTPEVVGDRPANLAGALEAILLVVDEPVSPDVLAEVLSVSIAEATDALAGLARQYAEDSRGFDLRRAAGGWRLYTRGEYAAYVERFVLDGQSVRLTQAALETLAVIAYQQPVTRSRMSAIRGVNCDGVVRTLANRGLIEECGTQPDSGAFLYRTTPLFLEKLGLDSLDELPPLAPFLPDDVNGFADA